MGGGPGMAYRVGPADELVWVSPEWDRFALANGGEAAVAARVLGRPLWDFVWGSTARELYRHLLRRARAAPTVRFPFRCDSPGSVRLLEMEVERGGAGTVQFRTRPLGQESRPPSPGWPPRPTGRSGCVGGAAGSGWRKRGSRSRRPSPEWACSAPHLPPASHGICEPCYVAMTRVLDG